MVKKIRKLHLEPSFYQLTIKITNSWASFIVRSQPQLEHLALCKCDISSKALFTILEGLKEPKCLDTRHAILFHEESEGYQIKRNSIGNSIAWNEYEIRTRSPGITYLKCSRESCPVCYKYCNKTNSNVPI